MTNDRGGADQSTPIMDASLDPNNHSNELSGTGLGQSGGSICLALGPAAKTFVISTGSKRAGRPHTSRALNPRALKGNKATLNFGAGPSAAVASIRIIRVEAHRHGIILIIRQCRFEAAGELYLALQSTLISGSYHGSPCCVGWIIQGTPAARKLLVTIWISFEGTPSDNSL